MPRGEDGSFLALEWHIEGRGGGSTVVRCVASGFIGSDDWEAEYDSLKAGVAFYFHNLAQCLTYFPGRTATPITAAQPRTGALEHSWTVLQGGLGLTGTVSDGEQVRLTPHGLPPIEGAVDYATPDFLGVRTSDGLYRFFPGTGGPRASMVVVEHHIFSDVDQVETERAWQSWLAELFA
jgi:hypothetical protein